MINPHAIAVCGVGYKPLTLATDGFIYSKSKKKKIFIPDQTSTQQMGGYQSSGTGYSGYALRQFFAEKRKGEDLDWADFIFSEIESYQTRKRFAEKFLSAINVESISKKWICTDDALMLAAQAASAGRLEVSVRNWSVRELINKGKPENDRDRIGILFEAVRESMYFVPNPVGAQWISGADVTTDDGTNKGSLAAGSCIDYAIKLSSSLLSVGIRSALVGQSSRSDKQLDHVAVAAWDGQEWIRLDPSEKSMKIGDARPSTRELWIHLPEMTIASDGPSPQNIKMPEAKFDRSFQVVGIGRLGWPEIVPVTQQKYRTVQNDSVRRSVGESGTYSGISWGALLATAVTVSVFVFALKAFCDSSTR
jgi:hypothetical protein